MAATLKNAFDPRTNSIGFLRWLLATAVIFSHAGPLAGFYGYKNLGTQWSDEQSFGGVAVAGFFFLSGFLITKSRMGRSTLARFLWRRVLRIMPAFWAALIATAFLLAPLSWWHVHHTLSGYFSSSNESPLTYFSHNMWLHVTQHNISGMGSTLPLAHCCGYDWNGSSWTLIYEFTGYLLIGALGLVGFLGYRKIALALFAFWLLLNTATFLSIPVHINVIAPLMNNFFAVMLLTPFLFGMVFALYDDRIVIDDRIALGAAAVAFYTYFIASGWNVYGQFAFLYVVMWCAIRLPLTNWERIGDLSYGIYIYAWPIMEVASFYHLQDRGWLAYHVGVLLACHVAAFLSWHLLEKRALALKNWTPEWLVHVQRRSRPFIGRLRSRFDNPEFSSTRYAASRRAGATGGAPNDDLVTHDPSARVHPRHLGHETPTSRLGARATGRRGPVRIASTVVASVLGVTVFVMLGWGLPAVYQHRYEAKVRTVSLSGVRDPAGRLVPSHAQPTAAQLATFTEHTAGAGQSAVVGRDGYYFLGDQYVHDLSQAMGYRFYSPQEVIDTAATVRAEKAWLARRGVSFDFVVAPANWDTYADKLPQWSDGQRLPTIYDQLNSYDPGLLVDLRPALTSARTVAETYSKLNSHWTPYGGFVAYQQLATHLAQTIPGIGKLRTPTLESVHASDASNEFAGIVPGTGHNDWTVPQFTGPLPPYHLTDSIGTNSEVPGDRSLDMMSMPLTTSSASAGNSTRALILCDSTITSMSPYLAGAFGSTMMVRHFIDDPASEPSLPDLISSYHPNVVIVMVTERNLDLPITNQLKRWTAANAFDASPSPDRSLPVTPTATSVTLQVPAEFKSGFTVRLSATAASTATIGVGAVTLSGAFTESIALTKGSNTIFFKVPTDATTLTLTGPVDALSAVSAAARPLSS